MVRVWAWVGCGIWFLSWENSENAQRELRDSVKKSLYAGQAGENAFAAKK
jgi:hypothetical protein